MAGSRGTESRRWDRCAVVDQHSGIPGDLPEPEILPGRRFPLVWLVPIAACLIGLGMLIHSWRTSGPRISIEFAAAEGLEAGKTHVSYKEVVIGTVSGVALNKGRTGVVATVDMTRDARDLLKDDTRFWIVRPQIGAGGVSGIETLLSGVYITLDPGSSDQLQTRFKGLDGPPPLTRDSAGTSFVLKAADIGSLSVGAPIYFHHLKAGRLVSYRMGPDKSLDIQIFVDAPYDRFVDPTTRFWNASGVDVSLTAAGLKVNTQSLATIIAGGIAFDDPPDTAVVTAAAPANSVFYLAVDRATAMADPDGPALYVRLRFDEPLRGLTVGAPVEFYGVSIGNVTKLAVDFDPTTQKFSLLVDVVAYPHRLGSVLAKFPTGNDDQDKIAIFIGSLVRSGLRAQARTGNLVTGQLYIALDFIKSVPPAAYDVSARPLLIPTATGTVNRLQAQIGDFVTKLDRLPLDSIGKGLDHDVAQLGATLQLLNTSTLPNASATLSDARKVMQGAGGALDPDASLQMNLNNLLQEVTRSARSLRMLTEMLSAHPESLLRGRQSSPAAPPNRKPSSDDTGVPVK
jgi:paraquat-inducible protein B